MNKKEFGKLVKHFRKRLKYIEFKVVIKKNKSELGYCTFKKGKYLVVIDKRQSMNCRLLLLVHEMAHVLSYNMETDPSDHGDMFGVAYARCWRIYLDWIENG